MQALGPDHQDKIDRGIAKSEAAQEVDTAPRIPPPSTFQPYKGQRRKPGTGCISQINDHLWEGRYSPTINGKRMARNVYAKTEKECEEKLAALIQEMRARDRHREGTGNGGMKCTGLRRLFRRSPNFFWLLLPEARQIRASK